MNRLALRELLPPLPALLLIACGFATDPATRLAYDIEAAVGLLAGDEGARYTVYHRTPSKTGECEGPYKVQLDRVGALIIWCHDAAGQTISSHSTTYHARFVDTPQTYLIDRPARATLTIELELRRGRAVVTGAY